MTIHYNFDLTSFNSYKVKAMCAAAYFPNTEKELRDLFVERNRNLIVLGNGNNIILSKTFYEESFVILNGCLNQVQVDGTLIEADAGATILQVSEMALQHGLTGAEFYFDIPSSVGGAVVMNAGTKEGVTQDILERVRYLDLSDMLIKEKNNNELELAYRNSVFQNDSEKIVLKAWFKLRNGNKKDIVTLMKTSKKRRWKRQPRELANCGSVFKRPPGLYVGPIIEDLGLKGYTIGGAQVSEKHAGFIVNSGGATGADILAVIDEIKTQVKKVFNVELEVEQRII